MAALFSEQCTIVYRLLTYRYAKHSMWFKFLCWVQTLHASKLQHRTWGVFKTRLVFQTRLLFQAWLLFI